MTNQQARGIFVISATPFADYEEMDHESADSRMGLYLGEGLIMVSSDMREHDVLQVRWSEP